MVSSSGSSTKGFVSGTTTGSATTSSSATTSESAEDQDVTTSEESAEEWNGYSSRGEMTYKGKTLPDSNGYLFTFSSTYDNAGRTYSAHHSDVIRV